MAPAPDVNSIIADIDALLAELAPRIAEHARLTAARAELTGNGTASARPTRGRPARAARAARRTARGRAPRGANRAAILEYVDKNPGATVAQISDATGIARPTLHTTVYALKRRGELVAHGRGVQKSTAGRSTRPRPNARRRAARRAGSRRGAARRSASGRAAAKGSTSAPRVARTGTTDADGTEPRQP
jgi:IclR-like helix-turn-helix domain-containing protein